MKQFDLKTWKNMPQTAFITITPEMAKQMLERNYEKNRSIRHADVATYAADIKSGNWHPMRSQPIVFTKDGILIDGQHRLHAVVLADQSIKSWVHFDASINDFVFIDGGVPRKAEDFIDIPYKTGVTALARSAAAIENGSSIRSAIANSDSTIRSKSSRGKISRKQVIDYVNKNTSELIECIKTSELIRNECYRKGSRKETALFVWVVRKAERDDHLLEFAESCRFENASKNAELYRQWLVNAYTNGHHPFRLEQLKKLFESYEDFRVGRTKAKFGKSSERYLDEYDAILKTVFGTNGEEI